MPREVYGELCFLEPRPRVFGVGGVLSIQFVFEPRLLLLGIGPLFLAASHKNDRCDTYERSEGKGVDETGCQFARMGDGFGNGVIFQ